MAEPHYGVSHMAAPIYLFYRAGTVDCMGTVGQRIRDLRKQKGLTQPALAQLAGIDQSTVSDIERGARFGADILVRLSEALEATTDYIMRGEIAAWPFKKIELSRLLSLSAEDRAYVEGRLESAIESAEERRAVTQDSTHQQTGAEISGTRNPERKRRLTPSKSLFDVQTGTPNEVGKAGRLSKQRGR